MRLTTSFYGIVCWSKQCHVEVGTGHAGVNSVDNKVRWPRRSLVIAHWPFSCAKRLHIGDSNFESPISNLLGHRAKRLHIGDSNPRRISNLLGHGAKRLHIGDSNLESPIF